MLYSTIKRICYISKLNYKKMTILWVLILFNMRGVVYVRGVEYVCGVQKKLKLKYHDVTNKN